MYNDDNENEIDYDKLEENFRRAVLNKKGAQASSRRTKTKKVKFNPKPLLSYVFIAMVVVAVIGLVNSRPKTIDVNKKIVDNILYQDIVEDGTVVRKKDKKDSKKENKEAAEKVAEGEKKIETTNSAVVENPKTDEIIVGKGRTVESVSQNAINQSIPEDMLEKIPKGNAYTIQVAAGKSAEDAKKMADALMKSGYPAVCVKEGTFYRVLVGNFATREKATEYGNVLLDKKIIKYFYPRFKSN